MPGLPIEVVLFKSENCAGCQAADRIISSKVSELNSSQEAVRLIKYDIDTEEGFKEAEKMGVESTPAVFVSGERYMGKIGDEFFEFLCKKISEKAKALA
ncbi:MAG: thioredoxin family protein [Candidatus Methanosuratincola sp.]|jgi:protein-disulfide isomerase|uniref:Thioredoxin-like fold domain-containing protein n=1 Tax=Candidatus Methanosuratincola petrocarbonis (ex Vanwonterghem et al. 2016) TaxID=1867261 RepID=A0A7J3UZJ0_9CREN|nr:thioredoxin family protein [Candidatus Methanosuratincola sp.]